MTAALQRHYFADRDALATALAATVGDLLTRAIERRGTGFLAVSGGTTPARFFDTLSRVPIDWKNVTVTLVDERFVPPSSPRSNAALVTGKLLQNRAAAARFVPLYQDADDAEIAAESVAPTLDHLPWPLDAAILGMGTDGHTASFFPDAEALDTLLDPGVASIVLPVHARSAGEPRLTLTARALTDAGFLALHIEGAEKRAALEQALASAQKLPIRRVLEQAQRPVQIYWAP